jgi:hypothetical protein
LRREARRSSGAEAQDYDERAMKKLLSLAAVLTLSGALAATAAASLRTYIVGTKYVRGVGTVGSLKGNVKSPYKIILFCEGVNARCGAKVACVRGTSFLTWKRTGLAPGTWNLKKKTWAGLDSCRFTVTIRSGARNARATVQATVHT